jgi:hypothetical protein
LTAALVLCLLVGSPESELLEDDLQLPADYEWSEVLYDHVTAPPDSTGALSWNAGTLNAGAATPALSPESAASGPPVSRRKPPTNSELQARVMLRDGIDDLSASSPLVDGSQAARISAAIGGLNLALLAGAAPGATKSFDVLAGGLEYRYRNGRFFVGDYELHSGQGMMFGRNHENWLTPNLSQPPPAGFANLPSSFSENTLLQGVGWAQSIGPVNAGVFLSENRLDAKANPDSTIQSIVSDGSKNDSTAQAERNRLLEDLAGARLELIRPSVRVAIEGYTNRYDPIIRSDTTGVGFSGRGLSVISADGAYRTSDYLLELEAAHTLGFGWAGGLNLLGNWERMSTQVDLNYLQQNFFSPHGADRSLSRAHDDLDGTFRASYQAAGWTARLYGTTSRDYVLDSMPARLELGVANQGARFHFGLDWKESYKDESPQSSGSRLDLGYALSQECELNFRLDDRFATAQPGARGIAATAGADWQHNGISLATKVTRYDVSQSSVRVYAYEPGFPGNNRSFTGNGWRWYLAGLVPFMNHYRVRCKLGATAGKSLTYDAGLGLEASI